MRLALLVAVVGVTSPALADDAEEAEGNCNVRVIKAPKRVRAAIEARVGIESACTPLEVRVTKQRRGFRVTAQREDGETREGTAKDPGLAAELVMSWAALPEEPVAAVEEPPPSPSVAEEPAPDEPVAEPVVIERVAVPARSRESVRDLGVGVLASPISVGVRAEADILAWRGWALGVAFGAGNASWSVGDAMTGATIDLRDLSGAAYVAKTFGTGAWRLRLQAGVGFVYTEHATKARTAPFDAISEGNGTTRMLDASIALSRSLSSSWALSLGPLMTYYAQTFTLDASREPTRELDVGGYLAIKRRL